MIQTIVEGTMITIYSYVQMMVGHGISFGALIHLRHRTIARAPLHHHRIVIAVIVVTAMFLPVIGATVTVVIRVIVVIVVVEIAIV